MQRSKTNLRRSSLGVTRILGQHYVKQRTRDQKFLNLKEINEVDSLKGVFYSFFEMQDAERKSNRNNKILVSC